MENLSIVPYPPPQYCYSWEKLQPVERKTAFEELQRINKGEFRARSGLTPRDGYERKEWRSWYELDPYERQHIFKKLKASYNVVRSNQKLTRISARAQELREGRGPNADHNDSKTQVHRTR